MTEWTVVEDDIEAHLMCDGVKFLSVPNYDVKDKLDQIAAKLNVLEKVKALALKLIHTRNCQHAYQFSDPLKCICGVQSLLDELAKEKP